MAEDTASDQGEKSSSAAALDERRSLNNVQVEITAVLGTADMPISQILKLGRGAVVELNRSVGENIEIHANNHLVAMGDVVVIEDRLGVKMTEILKISQTMKQ
ncbi:MAG: flagellar motor switch protein FliN [Rhodospirillaceae bacterium]